MRMLATARLQLEPVSESNAAVLWRVMQSEDLREFQDVPKLARADFVRRVAARPKRFDGRTAGRFEWLIRRRDLGVPIGWVSLRVGENARGTAEVGYSLVREARRQGFAVEATETVIASAFEIGLGRIDACCVPDNAPSRRLLETLGFSLVRVQSNGAVVRGKPVDICIYQLAAGAWRPTLGDAGGSVAKARPRTRS